MKWLLTVTGVLISLQTMPQTRPLKIIKSTVQKVRHGAAPGSSVTYRIEFKKITKNEIRIDSVLTAADLKKVDFYLFKKKDKTEIPLTEMVLAAKDKSVFVLTFGQTRQEDFDRRGRSAEHVNEPVGDFSKGVIIYFRNGQKQEIITVKDFKIMEKINAP